MLPSTPGVYLQQSVNTAPRPLEMGVAGFVGLAERGPVNQPQRLTSWDAFRAWYGDFTDYGFLGYAVHGFFRNGGRTCYVNRVACSTARAASALVGTQDAPVMVIQAIDPGEWGNAIEVQLDPQSDRHILYGTIHQPITAGSNDTAIKPSQTIIPPFGRRIFQVNLVAPRSPIRQEGVTFELTDTGEVMVRTEIRHDFPSGTRILGPGFKLVFVLQAPGGRRIETFDRLSPDPSHARYFATVINGDPYETDIRKRSSAGWSTLVKVLDAADPEHRDAVREARPLDALPANRLKDGKNGAHFLLPEEFTGYKNLGGMFVPLTNNAMEPLDVGLHRLEQVEEIDLVTIPDLSLEYMHQSRALPGNLRLVECGPINATLKTPNIQHDQAGAFQRMLEGQAAMLHHCELMQDRFAILDPPPQPPNRDAIHQAVNNSRHFHLMRSSRNGALYFPWVKTMGTLNNPKQPFVPPCGHIAGIYSRTARNSRLGGVPANEPLQAVVDLSVYVADAQQDLLNPRGVNCLRFFPGRGIRIWGARTLSYDAQWLYINVRRTYQALVKFIKVNLTRLVFEPNAPQLWSRVSSLLTRYLTDLFRNGALRGATPEEAFFVQCDAELNTPENVDAGRMLVVLGFAPAKPAEFIMVRVVRNGSDVVVETEF